MVLSHFGAWRENQVRFDAEPEGECSIGQNSSLISQAACNEILADIPLPLQQLNDTEACLEVEPR